MANEIQMRREIASGGRGGAAPEAGRWDTSEHGWLEGRGPELHVISMIDGATSRLLVRLVSRDSTEENMRLLETYLNLNERPPNFLYLPRPFCSPNCRNQAQRSYRQGSPGTVAHSDWQALKALHSSGLAPFQIRVSPCA